MNLNNYNFTSKPLLNTKNGGVGFYVKKSLTFWLRNDITFFAEGSQSISNELQFDKIDIICGVIYSPLKHNFDANSTFMSNHLLTFKIKNEKKIVF